MDRLERLASLFERFPGIGPRQAQRFVQFLLRSSPTLRRELSEAIAEVGRAVSRCPSCMRFHAGEKGACSICRDTRRNTEVLAIVATDADLSALERSESFRGHYFVLGGTVPLSASKPVELHERELVGRVKDRARSGLKEIILALPAHPEGDATSEHIRELLRALKDIELKITALGRGLSTGSELEYADTDTLKSALESRK